MKTIQLEQENPVSALEALSTTASLEAFSLKSVANRVADILPTMAHAFRQFAHTHKSDKLDLTPLNVNRTILSKALDSAQYLSIAKFAVVVPQGHVGSMPAYLDVLQEGMVFTNGIVQRMTAYNQLLSSLISSRDARNSTRDMSTATEKMEVERDSIKSKLMVFSKTNSRADRKPLGETYRSLAELSTAVEQTHTVVNTAIELNLQSVSQLIRDAVELLDELERRASEGTIENLSNQMYKSLASSTLTMARDAEFHALMCFKAWEAKNCMETTCTELIKALRY